MTPPPQPHEPLLVGWIIVAIFDNNRDNNNNKAKQHSTNVQPHGVDCQCYFE